MTFTEICEREPRIADLKRQLPRILAPHWPVTFWWGWEEVKERLVKLAGWNAAVEDLRSHEAYDAAYQGMLAEAEQIWDHFRIAVTDGEYPELRRLFFGLNGESMHLSSCGCCGATRGYGHGERCVAVN